PSFRTYWGSAPELAGGQCRALGQRFELGPGDVRVNPAAETAVGRGDDPLPADQVREAKDALGDELGVLDDIGSVADHTGQDHLFVRQFDVLPHLPFVLVADISGLERVGVRVDRQHDIDDVAHRDVG